MIGFHSVSVIADAAAKGIDNFDTNLVCQAVEAAYTYSLFGIPAFNEKGFYKSMMKAKALVNPSSMDMIIGA